MNYYDTLGVEKSASADEIKAAYRKLAMKHHPDKGGDEKQFQKITEAYDTLSNPDKKAFYDQGGRHQGNPFSGFHEFRSGHPFNGDPFGNPFEDIFTQFGFGFQNSRPRQKNSDLQIKVRISLKDSYLGKSMNIDYPLPSGKNQSAEIKIPAGIFSGQHMRLGGMGDDSIKELSRGDLIVIIEVDNDPIFYREELSLITKTTIDVFDAMIGCKKIIKNINGNEIELIIKPGTQNGQKYSCQGLGFPNLRFDNVKGDLIIQINVDIPVVKDPNLISMINALATHIRNNKKNN